MNGWLLVSLLLGAVVAYWGARACVWAVAFVERADQQIDALIRDSQPLIPYQCAREGQRW